MVTLLKLGGSILTDPARLFSFEKGTAIRLAREIRQSGQVPVIVHGTGRAGKAFARHYSGAGRTTREWLIFQLTTGAIGRLGEDLGRVLRDEGVPHCLMPANGLLHRRGGELGWHSPGVLPHLLDCGIAPVLCGDVLAEGRTRFGIVSSDEIVSLAAATMTVRSCVFVTNVDGLLDPAGRLLTEIDAAHLPQARDSDRADVTGGMSAKLASALRAAESGAATTIVNGRVPGRLRDALLGRPVIGTRVLATNTAATAAIGAAQRRNVATAPAVAETSRLPGASLAASKDRGTV
jgi:isopentenyl phosphate kinase